MSHEVGHRYQGVPDFWAEDRKDEHTRLLAQRVNDLLRGRMNVVYEVTLAPDTTTTIIESVNITAQSVATWMPLTSSAAAAQSVLSAVATKGRITFTHDSSPATDRTLRVAVLG